MPYVSRNARGMGDCSAGAGTIDPATGLICLDTSAVPVTPIAAVPPASISPASEASALNQMDIANQYALSSFTGPVATASTAPAAAPFSIPWGGVAIAAGFLIFASFLGGGRR